MTTELGTELGTTLGTILSSMEIEGLPTFDTSKMYAIRPASGAYYATLAGGGEGGIASGFGVITIARVSQSVASASRGLADNLFTSPVEGWTVNTSGTNTGVLAAFVSGAGASVSSPTYTLAPSDAGKILCIVAQHSGTQSRVGVSRSAMLGTAITGYTPSSTRIMGLGARANIGNIPADGVDIFGSLTFRGTPTDPQLLALQDLVRTLGDVPSKAAAEAVMPGTTITHRSSVRDTLQAANVPVSDGQAGPASIPDSVTAASIDVLGKVGSPTVRLIDPASYPRTSYGALGFSGTNYFEAPSLSRTAATGSWFAVWATPWLIAVNGQTYRTLLGFARGAILIVSGSTLQVQTGTSNLATYTLTSANVGSPMLICGTYDGTAGQAYVNGVSTGAAVTHAETGAASILRFGAEYTAAASWAGDWTLHGYAMGRTPGGISAAEALAHYNACVATGRIQPIAGKTEHIVDLTQDVVANGGPQNGVPATAQDRIGTDHLTRVGGLRVDTSGLTGFASTAGYLRSVGVGLQGSAGGFSGEALFIARTATGTHALCAHSHSATTGYAVYYTGTLAIAMSNGTTIVNHSLGAVNANALNHVAWVFNGTQLRTFVNGTLRTSNAQTAYAFTAGANNFYAGAQSTSQFPGLDAFVLREVGGSNTDVWSDAEVATAAASALSTGRLAGVPSKTQKQWSITQDTASGAVPALITDRVAGTDPLVVVNNKLEVAQRTERLWSYETTPILYGSQAPTNAAGTDFWETSTQLGETGASSWWAAVFFMVLSQSVTSTPREMLGSVASTPSRGFTIRTNLANSTVNLLAIDNAATGRAAPAGAIAAADVGKLQLYVGAYDQPALTLRSYFKRAQVSAGTAVTGYTPSTTNGFRIGQAFLSTLSANADGIAIYGVAAGLGLPSLAEIQAQYDATMASERIAGIAGKTSFRIDLTADASGGALPSTLSNRDGAGFTFTKNGSPGTQAQYARSWGW